MKKKGVTLFTILMIGLVVFGEKAIDQKIANLEKKLQTVSGKEKIVLLNELAYEYQNQSFEKCLNYANQALKLSQKLNDAKGEAIALNNVGLGYRVSGNYEKALDFCQKALNAFKKTGDWKKTSDTLRNVGIIYEMLGNFNKSLEYRLKSLKIGEEIGDKKTIALSFSGIGNVYGKTGNYDTALEYFRKAVKIFEEMGDKKSMAAPLCNMGIIYRILSKYEKSLEYQLKSLEIREEIGNKSGTADSLNNIGNVYRELSNYDKALEYYLKSLKLREEVGNRSRVAQSLYNIGTIHCELTHYHKALEHFNKSLKITEEIGDRSGITNALTSIGVAYEGLKDYEMALEYYLKSLKILEEIGDKLRMAISFDNVGSIYIKMKNFGKALENLEKGLKIAKEINAKDSIKESYEKFSKLYAAMGNFKKAFEYHKLYSEVKDALFNEKSSRQIAEMQTRYDTLKKEKEIVILKKNTEILEKNNKIQKITRNTFIIGFIMVSIILALLFKKYVYLFSFWKKQKYVGRFRLMEEIGSGGMGSIYKAHSIRDKTEIVAIKVLKQELFKDENNRKRFKQEAAIIDKLEHPNIIKIIERGEYKERLFIAMELLEGKTLNVKIDEEGQIELNDCLHIMIQISDALMLIHHKEIIHRDLKPSNIMLIERDGDPNFVKLLDFGLAKMKFQTRLTKTGILAGTINYMSPEQLAKSEYSSASDIYSLGVTFYEMVTGKIAFPGETATDIMKQILDKTPVEPHRFRPGIPVELNDLIMKMIEKRKKSRPAIKRIFESLQKIKSRYN